MLAFTLGLSAALLWGISDFIAGVQSRRVPLPVVTCISQGFSLSVLALIVLAAGTAVPEAGPILVAFLGGLAMTVGVTGFYGAMARGAISIAAPIASTGIAIPVAVGLLQGERPHVIQLVGVAAAAVGVIVASRGESKAGADHRKSVLLAILAAFGFGWFFVGMDAAANSGANLLWMLFCARIGTLTGLLCVLGWVRPPLAVPRRTGLLLMGIGCIDLTANAFYLLASSSGLMTLVSVLGSLYALVTLLLARQVLRERLSQRQGFGVALSFSGTVMIAAAV